MRVGFDARILTGRRRTGIGQYAYHLIRSLAHTFPSDRFFLFYPSLGDSADFPSFPSPPVRAVPVPVSDGHREALFHLLWLDLLLPLYARFFRIDLFHGPSFTLPRRLGRPSVVTVHDMAHVLFPEFALGCSPRFLRRGEESARRANGVIAVSRSTKRDLQSLYGLGPERIRVIHEAASAEFQSERTGKDVLRCLRRRGLRAPYLLSVLSLHPRKNCLGLIRAYALLEKKKKGLPPLVLVGKAYDPAPVRDLVRELGLEGRVILLGYIPPEELPLLYRGASIFVYPPFYEGFGLPPLEAMASDLPVVASATSSLPEVLGDAARYVDPSSERSIAEGILDLLEDSDLREALRKRGRARSSQFSWSRAARETRALYLELTGV